MPGAPQSTSLWPVTNWSALRHAADAIGGQPGPLDDLIRRYQHPLKVFLTSKFPWLASEAEQLVIEFAEDRILKEGWLRKPQAERGRFRDFLKCSLVHFVQDRYRKKDVSRLATPLDELDREPAAPTPSSSAFDLDWTRTLLAETLSRMEADCRKPGRDQPRRSHIWEIFQIRLLGPMLENAEPWPYELVVERFQLRSPTDAFNLLNSAKRIFSRHLKNVIAEYEGDSRVAAELAELKSLVGAWADAKAEAVRRPKPNGV